MEFLRHRVGLGSSGQMGGGSEVQGTFYTLLFSHLLRLFFLSLFILLEVSVHLLGV